MQFFKCSPSYYHVGLNVILCQEMERSGDENMKHKVKVKVPVEKRGFLGIKKTVMETRIIEVDDKTYKKMKRDWANRPYSIDEMLFYDDIIYAE